MHILKGIFLLLLAGGSYGATISKYIILCNANVLPIETTYFVCVQNLVIDDMYFFKSHFLKTTD